MRRELLSAISEVESIGSYTVADYMKHNGYIPSKDEIAILIKEEKHVAKDASGMPICDDEHIVLTASDIESINPAFIIEDKALCCTANGASWLPIVESSYDQSIFDAEGIYRIAYNAVADALEEEGLYDMEPFLSPCCEEYPDGIFCPNCGDCECFPTHTEEGLQHYICNECGVDFVCTEEHEPEPEIIDVPIDKFSSISISKLGDDVDWKLIVEGSVVNDGKTNDVYDAIKNANLAYHRAYIGFCNDFSEGTEFFASDGTCRKIVSKNNGYYMIDDGNGNIEVFAGEDIDKNLQDEEFIYAEDEDKVIDDIEQGDIFASCDGKIAVDSRSRSTIFYTYEPYNEILTASEAINAMPAYDFCQMVKNMERM